MLTIDNSELLLRPGMTATAEIRVTEVKGATLIPNASLRYQPPATTADDRSLLRRMMPGPPSFRAASTTREETGANRSVWTLNNNVPTPVKVVIGPSDGKRTQIVGGDLTVGHNVNRRPIDRQRKRTRPCWTRALQAPLIEFRGVSKVFGAGSAAAVHALDNVDLAIAENEFVAIMGPSGSGKSTVMNIIGCLDTPTSGDYLFQGVEVGRLDRNKRALIRRHLLGFVFQGFNLLARTTALENVELPLIYRGVPAVERRKLAADALDRVGLAHREKHTTSELSGGQQQRVAIARAIVTDPEILLADEPTGNLDTRTSREIMDLVTEPQSRPRRITVVMVTHETDIAAFARRTIRFVDGRIESDTANAEAA